jgi:membrane-associated phospholipid phosphatase
VAIGLSRLYLGVHYFSDVVGGYAAGVLWLSACISGLEVARRWGGGAELPRAAPSKAP